MQRFTLKNARVSVSQHFTKALHFYRWLVYTLRKKLKLIRQKNNCVNWSNLTAESIRFFYDCLCAVYVYSYNGWAILYQFIDRNADIENVFLHWKETNSNVWLRIKSRLLWKYTLPVEMQLESIFEKVYHKLSFWYWNLFIFHNQYEKSQFYLWIT